jgi:hypothetical protein
MGRTGRTHSMSTWAIYLLGHKDIHRSGLLEQSKAIAKVKRKRKRQTALDLRGQAHPSKAFIPHGTVVKMSAQGDSVPTVAW